MVSAVLSARRDAGGGLQLVSLGVPEETARAYVTPGQYLEVKTASGNGYFVLASDVAERPWQLLVKSSGGASEALLTLPIGTELEVGGPFGTGFSVERMRSRHVVVAVVGSALAVARPVIRQRIEDGSAGVTHLFLGLRTLLDLPLAAEVESWTARGVRVVLCVSRSELHHHPEVLPRARRAAGYVQHALSHALADGEVPHGTLVIAAGHDALLADMRALGERERAPGSPETPGQRGELAGGGTGTSRGAVEETQPPRIEVLTNV